VRIRNKIGGAVQAVGTIRLGVGVDAVAARAAGSSQNLVSRSHYVNRGRPFWPSGGRRADAACAFSREPRDVGAPRAVYQIGKQLGQAGAHSTEFCTLDMSSADGSDLHAHDGQFAAGPARYNSVMRGCKTAQPCSQPFLLLDTLDHSRLQVPLPKKHKGTHGFCIGTANKPRREGQPSVQGAARSRGHVGLIAMAGPAVMRRMRQQVAARGLASRYAMSRLPQPQGPCSSPTRRPCGPLRCCTPRGFAPALPMVLLCQRSRLWRRSTRAVR
jgi:hypothetical protein